MRIMPVDRVHFVGAYHIAFECVCCSVDCVDRTGCIEVWAALHFNTKQSQLHCGGCDDNIVVCCRHYITHVFLGWAWRESSPVWLTQTARLDDLGPVCTVALRVVGGAMLTLAFPMADQRHGPDWDVSQVQTNPNCAHQWGTRNQGNFFC